MKIYGDMTDEELNAWERSPVVINILSSREFGAWLQRRDENKARQKTGYWRHYESMLICSECGSEFYDDIMEYCGDNVPKCCPDCGMKMEEQK